LSTDQPREPEEPVGFIERLHRARRLARKRRQLRRQTRRERREGVTDEGYPVPPPLLRYRVHGRKDLQSFISDGRGLAASVRTLAESQGRNLVDYDAVLDFGCGCGRVLRYLQPDAPTTRFYGCDIDPDAITWCQQNFADLAEFSLNPDRPPTPYADGTFDLIYAVSVFTHLGEDYQFAWLEELSRIARPGALLLLSVHSQSSWPDLRESELADLEKNGIALQRAYNRYLEVAGLPPFYQNAFHTRDYLEREWSKRFEILDMVVHGIGNQDVMVLRKG